MESVSTRLNDETYRLIRETADERGVSMAEVLRELIEKGGEYDEMKRDYESGSTTSKERPSASRTKSG